jgi:hypothetical protein
MISSLPVSKSRIINEVLKSVRLMNASLVPSGDGMGRIASSVSAGDLGRLLGGGVVSPGREDPGVRVFVVVPVKRVHHIHATNIGNQLILNKPKKTILDCKKCTHYFKKI